MKIVFALVAHGNPRLVERMIRTLLSQGHQVAIHYDRKSPQAHYERLVSCFADCDAVRFAKRVRVGWATWSIVEATLNCLDEIEAAGWEPDYVYHASGSDYPIRSSVELISFLTRHQGTEFIQSVPADHIRWVRTGPQEERYQYRWHFNWREQRRFCQTLFWLQRKCGLKREFVRGMTPHIGSQWWVLTWDTLQKVRAHGREKDIRRFFRTTLVPDELFFQTLVRHLVPEARICNRTLTLYQFSDYGYPVVYYADHLDYLLRQPFFMARKLSHHGSELRDALDECWRGDRSARRFADDDIGIVGPEYEARRLTYRNGVPGRPVAGRVPDGRLGDLDRVKNPCFAVIGTSVAELRVVYKVLAQHPDVLCHGQLFHPRRIEFAEQRAQFAGYAAKELALREVSGPNFVADIIRAEKRRLSGFLLCPEQGGRISEVTFERPNIRVMVVRGDPMVAFTEHLLGSRQLLDDRFDPRVLEGIPPEIFAHRFWQFVAESRQQSEWLAGAMHNAGDSKPKHWVREVDLSPARAAVGARRLGEVHVPLATALTAWATSIEQCLGIDLEEVLGSATAELIADLARLEDLHSLVASRLAAGSATGIELDAPEVALARTAGPQWRFDERKLAHGDD